MMVALGVLDLKHTRALYVDQQRLKRIADHLSLGASKRGERASFINGGLHISSRQPTVILSSKRKRFWAEYTDPFDDAVVSENGDVYSGEAPSSPSEQPVSALDLDISGNSPGEDLGACISVCLPRKFANSSDKDDFEVIPRIGPDPVLDETRQEFGFDEKWEFVEAEKDEKNCSKTL